MKLERNVEIIQDVNGKWIVMIKKILFKGRIYMTL